MMWYIKGQKPTERTPNTQRWNNLSNKVNKVVLGYSPKYKINIHGTSLTGRYSIPDNLCRYSAPVWVEHGDALLKQCEKWGKKNNFIVEKSDKQFFTR